MSFIKEVPDLELLYRGKWVKARGISCYFYSGGMVGVNAVEGVTSNGYAKINKMKVKKFYGDAMLRYREEGSDWKVPVGQNMLGVYKKIDAEYMLTGVWCSRDDLEIEYVKGEFGDERIRVENVVVKTRKGMERLMEECGIIYKRVVGSKVGVYVEDGVNLEGFTRKDLLCVGSPWVHINKAQAEQIKWGKNVKYNTRVREGLFKPDLVGIIFKSIKVYVRGIGEIYEVWPDTTKVERSSVGELGVWV